MNVILIEANPFSFFEPIHNFSPKLNLFQLFLTNQLNDVCSSFDLH